jgi:HEPN domain-containing protein
MEASATYRLELARGFLREAQQDLTLQRWRSSVSHAQLTIENGLKAVIALFLPVAKTHDPARVLLELIARQQIPAQWQSTVQMLADMGHPFGPPLHVQTDYGDEYNGRLPWELFGEQEASETLATAEKIVKVVETLVEEVRRV